MSTTFKISIPVGNNEGAVRFDCTIEKYGNGWKAECPAMDTWVTVIHPAKERAILGLLWKLKGCFDWEATAIEDESDKDVGV